HHGPRGPGVALRSGPTDARLRPRRPGGAPASRRRVRRWRRRPRQTVARPTGAARRRGLPRSGAFRRITVADHLLVSTRKGLFVFPRKEGGGPARPPMSLGENAPPTRALPGRGWFAAMNLGHFGVKLRPPADEGQTWEERAVPAYPPGETV